LALHLSWTLTERAFGQAGLAAIDFDPKGKAAAEIRALFLWVSEKVGMLPSEQVTEKTSELA